MPPLRTGLVKRKLNRKDGELLKLEPDSYSEVSGGEELFHGELRNEDDTTDSEQEPARSDSDTEQDRVLFDGDNATFGEDIAEGAGDSDQSSLLTDSEDDNDSKESEGEEESEDEHSASTSGEPDKASPEAEVRRADEYESGDTSDEEDRLNTTGQVPAWWYREYPHVGYDLDGRRILRPPQRDQIDDFLKQCEDPEFWRTVRDPSTGQDVVLSAEDLELLARIRTGRVPDPGHEEYLPWVEWFTRTVLPTPVRSFPDHKRSFLPSESDRRRVSRLVHALKAGWIKTRRQLAEDRRRGKAKMFYDLWGSGPSPPAAARHRPLPAPRRPPPAHAESYNPPPEYLLDHKEMKEWNRLTATPWKRKYTYLPTAHSALRHVPAYPRYLRERFLRCLDLYLAPRAIKMRLTLTPSSLVPELPAPRDLRPFPTAEAVAFRGHGDVVRSCDLDPSGQYAVSGSDDGAVKIWEIATGRCLRTVEAGGPVARVRWGPVAGLGLVAVAVGARLLLLNPGPGVGADRVAADTDRLLESEGPPAVLGERARDAVRWEAAGTEERARGVRLALDHFRPIVHVSWHARGDYLAVSLSAGGSRSVLVHQISRRRSQVPFAKTKGLVQAAVFHPSRPLLFVATQRAVRIYDLVKQELVKKLSSGAQWISAMAVHPAGDNLLVASYDRKCMWFDLDLSSAPYQTLRLHGGAVRAVAFHKRYPLFATAGDDPYLVVSHGMVYNDLLQNPLLVPLKQLSCPPSKLDLHVLDLCFHPSQPWLLAAAADGTLRLYT